MLTKGAILKRTMITTTVQYFKYESWSCIPCCYLNVRVQTTVYYKNPKSILFMYCWDKEAETV